MIRVKPLDAGRVEASVVPYGPRVVDDSEHMAVEHVKTVHQANIWALRNELPSFMLEQIHRYDVVMEQ